MKLSQQQVEPEALKKLAVEASRWLCAGRFAELASRFGYAVALGRNPSAAIEEDLRTSLTDLREASLNPNADPEVQVEYFKPDDLLYAVASCRLATTEGQLLLAELVVSVAGEEFHVTLEQISAPGRLSRAPT